VIFDSEDLEAVIYLGNKNVAFDGVLNILLLGHARCE
jgi:hypothetical protein